MSYEVLARKWRPTQFSELVGQSHVVRALKHALENDRLHHAYLFTGTRGVGKTTIARLLTRCLNCEKGVTSVPCGQCDSCQEIARGRFIDLIEIDAASHTGVDSIREVLDSVLYAPVRGRYKVYLIDEVHMLSRQAFNALLITLEEPPPHVKFVLATTDPSKVPVTILSRCLQFHLRNLSPTAIADHLAKVMKEEGIEAEPEAMMHIAEAAEGAMRDALSLADQAIAFGGGKLLTDQVIEMLGVVDQQLTGTLLRALADDDVNELFHLADGYLKGTPDLDALFIALARLVQQVALVKAAPEVADQQVGDQDFLHELATSLSTEAVHLYYQAILQGRKDLSVAPDATAALHMTLLRMLAFKPLVDSNHEAASESGAPARQQKEKEKEKHSESKQSKSAPDSKQQSKLATQTKEPLHANPDLQPEATTTTMTEVETKQTVSLPDQPQQLPDPVIFTDEARARQKKADAEIDSDLLVETLKKEFSASIVIGSAHPITSE